MKIRYTAIIQCLPTGRSEAMNERQVVSGVVELAVRVFHRAEQPVTAQVRHAPQGFLARDKLAGRDARRTSEPVVNLEPDVQVGDIEPVKTWNQKLQFAREVRSVIEHSDALVQRADYHVVFLWIDVLDRLLQVANAPVNNLCRSAGSGPRKIAGLKQNCTQPAKLRIQCASGSRCSAANHAHIERFAVDIASLHCSRFHEAPRSDQKLTCVRNPKIAAFGIRELAPTST